MLKPVGVLGGTFDPVHKGHIGIATDVCQQCDFAELRFIPLFIPPHREQPVASAEQRLHMLRLALQGQQHLLVDERELLRQGVSYTVDTLRSLRKDLGSRPLCLVLGADAFVSLHTWKSWKEIPELAHLIVVGRPGIMPAPEEEELKALYKSAHSTDIADLQTQPAGRILVMELEEREVSSSAIRASIADEKALLNMLPEAVYSYIKEEGLYHQH